MGRILPDRLSALVRREWDELFSAAQHQAVSPDGWAKGAVRREGGGRRGWERAPCSPRTFSWPSSCRTAAQVRGGTGLGMMWGGAGRESRGRGGMSWAAGLEWCGWPGEEECMSQVHGMCACAQNVCLHLCGRAQGVSVCGVYIRMAEVGICCVSECAFIMWYLHIYWGSLCMWSLHMCVAEAGIYIAMCAHTSVKCLH